MIECVWRTRACTCVLGMEGTWVFDSMDLLQYGRPCIWPVTVLQESGLKTGDGA